jgi:uncharacterized protein Yka (UPF0111/DUF47 family)
MTKGVNFSIRAVDRTRQAFMSVKRGLLDIRRGAANVMRGFTSMRGIIAAALGGAAIRSIVSSADEMQKLSQRLGISTEALSQLKHAADLTGVSFNTMTSGLQRMTRNVAEAAQGTGTAVKALQELGVSALDLNRLSPEQQFEVLAEAMKGVENQSDRVRLAIRLFGNDGAALLQTMEGGADAIRAMRIEADELGLTLSQTEADAIASMNDAFGRMTSAIMGAVRSLVAFFAPALEAIADFLTRVFVGSVRLTKRIFQEFIAFVLQAYGKVVESIAWMSEKLSFLPGAAGDAMAELARSLRNHAEVFSMVETKTDDLASAQHKLNIQFKETDRLMEKIRRNPVKTTDSGDSAKRSREAAEKTRDHITQSIDEIEQAGKRGAEQLEDSFLNALMGVEGGFRSLKDTVRHVLMDINKALMKDALDHFGIGSGAGGSGIFGNILGGISGLFKGGSGGGLGGLFSGIGSLFGGFFADGGAVSGGKSYIVGERGPELFSPRAGGLITPNHALAGGGNVTVHMNIQTPDIHSFRKSGNQIAADMARSIERARRNL